MSKSSLVGTFVYDHSIFHIVASIRNNGDYSVCATRCLIEIIVYVVKRSNQWCLWEEQPINFIVHSIRVGMIGCSHSLLCHLTLIHVSWRLVVVAERNS
jgi:hypothetical protein